MTGFMKRVLLTGEYGDIHFDFTTHKTLITTGNKKLEREGKNLVYLWILYWSLPNENGFLAELPSVQNLSWIARMIVFMKMEIGLDIK